MMRLRLWLVISVMLASIVLLGGCLFSEPNNKPAGNVSGNWVGRTSGFRVEGIPPGIARTTVGADDQGNVAFDNGFALKLVLTQDQEGMVKGSATVTITISLGGLLPINLSKDFAVGGHVDGHTLNLEGSKQFFPDTPTFDIFLNSQVSDDFKSMSGDWSVYQGNNKVKGGTFTANRQ